MCAKYKFFLSQLKASGSMHTARPNIQIFCSCLHTKPSFILVTYHWASRKLVAKKSIYQGFQQNQQILIKHFLCCRWNTFSFFEATYWALSVCQALFEASSIYHKQNKLPTLKELTLQWRRTNKTNKYDND